MIRPILWGLTGIALALGLVHLGLSLLAWRGGSLDVLWFAGSGLAIVLAGLINVAMMRARTIDSVQRAVWFLSNLMTAAFFGAAWSVLPERQVIAGGVVFVALVLGCMGTTSGRARA